MTDFLAIAAVVLLLWITIILFAIWRALGRLEWELKRLPDDASTLASETHKIRVMIRRALKEQGLLNPDL
jgi:hypothetical protein